MRFEKGLASGLLAALLLAACGGGSSDGNQSPKVKFTSMVSFGDSLSDVGSYKVGGVADAGGGMFTVNSPAAKNWTQILAAQLGVAAPCAAQTGLTGSGAPYNFSVTPAYNTACRNYAQGGSRVTNPYGPGNTVLATAQGSTPPYVGALTVPITSQIDRHLTVATNFSGTELVTVMAGANDLFVQFSVLSVMQLLGGGVTPDQFTAYVTNFAGWTGPEATAVLTAGSPTAMTNAAAAVMVSKMTGVGTDLATMIKTKIKGNGAKYILVLNMPNVSKTPFAASLGNNPTGDGLRAIISGMTQAFNAALSAGLAGQSNIWLGDAYTTNTDQLNNPAQYGISNVTTPVCTVSSSLLCSTATTIVGDVSAYLFADSVHPTPYGYKLFAQEAAKHLVMAGWL